jgi:hypothetical protein
MAKKILATVFLCETPLNGIKTPMTREYATLMMDTKGRYYLKQRGGKKEWQYNHKLAWKTEFKGKMELLVFYDKNSDIQLNPKEIYSGEEFDRTDLRNLITGQLSAERRLRDRIGLEATNKTVTIIAIIFLVAAIFMVIGLVTEGQDLSNVHVYVQIVNSSYNATGASLGGTISKAAGSIGKAVSGIP